MDVFEMIEAQQGFGGYQQGFGSTGRRWSRPIPSWVRSAKL